MVATKSGSGTAYCMATGGRPMVHGEHYWEVELTEPGSGSLVNVGAVRPGLDYDVGHCYSNSVYCINGVYGSLFGCGKKACGGAGRFAKGDRIGCLLNLDDGWMRFYRNGVQCESGWTSGVTGPLLRAVEMVYQGTVVTVLPDAVRPPDAVEAPVAAATAAGGVGVGREGGRSGWPTAALPP